MLITLPCSRRALARRGVLALVLLGASASVARAQSDRPWVDPPAHAEAQEKAPGGSPGQATPPSDPPEPRPEPVPAVQSGKPAPAREPASATPEVRPDQGTEPGDPDRAGRPAEGDPGSKDAPPLRSARPPAMALPPEPEVASRPAGAVPGSQDPASAARRFAIDYLAFWSAPNATALETTPDFYAPRVEFYGRAMSARAILEEKRRFVRRWPERQYNPRLDTMQARCGPAALCVVRTVLDFTAANPERGKRSQGTARLELGVKFQGGRPVIVSETSRVDRRGQSARSEPFDDERD